MGGILSIVRKKVAGLGRAWEGLREACEEGVRRLEGGIDGSETPIRA